MYFYRVTLLVFFLGFIHSAFPVDHCVVPKITRRVEIDGNDQIINAISAQNNETFKTVPRGGNVYLTCPSNRQVVHEATCWTQGKWLLQESIKVVEDFSVCGSNNNDQLGEKVASIERATKQQSATISKLKKANKDLEAKLDALIAKLEAGKPNKRNCLRLQECQLLDELLYTAAFESNYSAAVDAISRGAMNSRRDESSGITAFHLAARRGNLEIVKAILAIPGTSVDVRNANDETPLMEAAFEGHLELVKFLVEKGADAEARTNDRAPNPNATALEMATEQAKSEIVEYLTEIVSKE